MYEHIILKSYAFRCNRILASYIRLANRILASFLRNGEQDPEKSFCVQEVKILKGSFQDFGSILNDSFCILDINPVRILLNPGYTILTGFHAFLPGSLFSNNDKPVNILVFSVLNRDRILLNLGYTLLSEFIRFLRKKWRILSGSLPDLSKICQRSTKDSP